MAGTGTLHAAVNEVMAELAELGIPATADPRNARPGAVLVQLPTFNTYTYNVLDIRIGIQVCGPAVGAKDVSDVVMTVVDKIVNSPIAITEGRPTTVEVGGQSLPAYELTVAIAVKRN